MTSLDDRLENALGVARAPVRAGALAAATAAGVAAFLAEERVLPMTYDRRHEYVRWWCRRALGALGVEAVADPASPALGPVPEGGRMVVSNHRSMLDILVLLERFGGHMLSRDDLARWPVVGWLARFPETLYVDRSSVISGAASIRDIADRLAERHTVTVFAEGTTFPDDEVRPFHPGAFVAAARAGGELVPVGLAYADPHAVYFQEPFARHAKRVLLARRTRVAVAVGEPIPAAGSTSKALGRVARERVQALVHRARSLL